MERECDDFEERGERVMVSERERERERERWICVFDVWRVRNVATSAVFGCCKTFFGKYIFFGNANFRKRKMFPCVWLYFKKFSGKNFLVFGKEGGKHKSENTSHNPEKKKIINSRNVSSPTTAITARSRFEIAIAILPSSRDHDRRCDRDLAVDRAVGLELELAISDWIFSSRVRARALSLSLSFSGNALKGK